MKQVFKLLLVILLCIQAGSINAQCPSTISIDLLQQVGSNVTVATTFQAPSGASIYVWDFGDGNSETSGWMTSHTYSQPGVYIIILNLYDSLNTTWCAQGILTIQIASAACNLQASFNPLNQPNGIVNFSNVSVTNGTAPYTYYWWFSDGQTSTLNQPVLVFENGFYQACLTVEDANGCYDSLCTSFSVTNGTCNNDYLSGQQNVNGSAVSLVISNNTNFSFPINISIEYGDGTVQTGQMSTAYTAFHDYAVSDSLFNLCVYAVDGNGCRDTLCYEISTAPCVDSSLFFTSIPLPNNLIQFIAASNSQEPISYLWTFGDGSPSATTTVNSIEHFYPSPGLYQVCLTTVDANGCQGTFCQTINAQGPCSNFFVTAGVSYTGLSATIIPQVSSSCGGLTYTWSAPQAISTTGNQTYTATYAAIGAYQILLTASDSCGCTQTITVPIVISCINSSGNPTSFLMQNGAITTCNGDFFDTGGQNGQYLNDQNFTLTVYPATPDAKVRVNFSSYSIENNFDYLAIHNGSNVDSPLLANLTGNFSGGLTYTSTSNDGSLTFRFASDFTVTSDGWTATLSCQDLNIQATNLLDGNWQLNAQSSTTYIDYIWVVDNLTYVTTVPTLNVPLSEGFHQVCLTANSALECTQSVCTQINVPCTYQLDVDVVTNGNQVDFIINNYDSTLYYYVYGQNTQTWLQLINDTTSLTFPAAINDLFCFYADGVCFDSACVQVTLSTEGTQQVSGIVWDDANGNGILDNGELPMPTIYVSLCAPGDTLTCLYTYTDNNGMYNFNVFPGEYTVQSYIWQPNYLATNPVGGEGYTITVADMSLGQFNFGWQNQSVTISGIVFYDTNNNGVQDPGENPASYKAVQIGNSVVYTNASGHYSVLRLPGTYVISLVNPGVGYSISVPAGGTYNVSASSIGQVYSGYNFGLWADPSFADLSADIHQISTVTPGFPVMNHLSYCNNGVSASAGVFTYYWDPMLAISSPSVFSPAPTSFNAASNSASWTFNSLAPGACGYIYMNASAPTTLVLGTPVFSTAIVTPLADSNPPNNIDTLHQTVVGSWDPNDKQGLPTGIGPEGKIFPNTQLTYTIRFQNTGTAPAVNVVLIDTISTDFVLETFQMNASSDDYSAQVDQSTRTIRWIFNNIMLPDSTSDPIGSIGFVNFSIDPIQNQVDGTVLNNFADIYFDFNEPIRTNTSVHTIDRFLGISDIQNGPNVQVYPNPFSTSTTFLVKTEDNSRSEVAVHDILGKTVSSFLIESGKPFTYSASQLSSGMYFYTVTNKNSSSTGKLLVK